MKPDQTKEETLFNAARALTDPKQRAAFLDAACQGDGELRRAIEALLTAQARAGVFFDRGPQDPGLGLPTTEAASSTRADSPASEKPGDLIGRYKLREKIGEGGCGVVYVAEQEEPVRRRVALKVIKLGMDTRQVVARFEAERQALAMMDHPNIAKIFDAGITEAPHPAAGPPAPETSRQAGHPLPSSEEGRGQGEGSRSLATRHSPLSTHYGRPYFVMELVRGIRITDYCDQNKLSTQQRLDLFVLVCNAVQHAHQKGIIHRDLKPSNILVTLHDGVPVPKVIDFGIAKATEGRLTDLTVYTELHQFIGTPAYMSPEQAEMSGLDIDTRSDIYSLGVLLYELLTGRTPFDATKLLAAGLDEIRRTIRDVEPPRPSTRLSTLAYGDLTTVAAARGSEALKLVSLIRGDLDWIVMKALEKDRTRRYETANSLAMDLKRHMNDEPVAARPPSAVYRIQKAFRRQKLLFTAGTAVAIAIIVGTAVSSIQWSRARREARAARVAEQHAQTNEARALDLVKRLRLQSYAADMKVASVALEDKNRGHAQELLQKYLPKSEEEDLRGLDWRYLWMQLRSDELDTIRGHDGIVRDVTFSADGKLMATVSFDRTARISEVASKRMVARLDGMVGDGLQHSIAFAPDGKTFAAVRNGHLTLWETGSWKSPRELGKAEEPVIFSPDGKALAACSGNGVKIWNTDTWRMDFLATGFSGGLMAALSISSDNRWLAASHSDKPIQLWNLQSQSKDQDFEAGNPRNIAFSPRRNQIAIGDWNGTVRLLDADTKQFIATNQTCAAIISGLAFSPDGERLATAGSDQLVQFHDGATLAKVATLKGHLHEVFAVAYSHDGRTLASAGKDGTVKLWRADPVAHTNSYEIPAEIKLLRFNSNRDRLRSVTANASLQYWNAADGKLTPAFAVPIDPTEPERFPTYVRCSPDGSRAGYGTTDGRVHIYDCGNGKVIKNLQAADSRVHVGAFSPDNSRLVVWKDEDRSASLWNLESDRPDVVLPDAHLARGFFGNPTAFDMFSPNGRFLAYVANHYMVNIWDIAEGRVCRILKGHVWKIWSMSFSPDGKFLATCSTDSDARVWVVETGKPAAGPLKGHQQGVHTVWFTHDSRMLVTASDDPTVRFWNLATGQETLTIKGAGEVLLSADDTTLVLRHREGVSMARIPTLAEIDAAQRVR